MSHFCGQMSALGCKKLHAAVRSDSFALLYRFFWDRLPYSVTPQNSHLANTAGLLFITAQKGIADPHLCFGVVRRVRLRKNAPRHSNRSPLCDMVVVMNNPVVRPVAVPVASSAKDENSDRTDRLDVAGQNVLALLERAADVGEEDYNHALDIAHKLSHQLQSADQRIKDLEAELRHFQHRADRAEKWLVKIAEEIEQRFFGKVDDDSNASAAGQRKL